MPSFFEILVLDFGALDVLDDYSIDYTSLIGGYENANDNIVNEAYSILKDGLGGKDNK